MDFSLTGEPIRQPHSGDSLSLLPTAITVIPQQARQLTDRAADCDRFNRRYLAENLEDHPDYTIVRPASTSLQRGRLYGRDKQIRYVSAWVAVKP